LQDDGAGAIVCYSFKAGESQLPACGIANCSGVVGRSGEICELHREMKYSRIFAMVALLFPETGLMAFIRGL
jgi:hypothetical protein